MSRILVAMSGGVDSSVAAALLKQQGHDVCGVTMKLLDKKPQDALSPRSCCGYDAARDAKLVADEMGIPHHVVHAVDVFRETVIGDFLDEYKNGRTPNPCVRCNRYVKFDYLMKKADELGCEFLATGHYAVRVENRLYKGADAAKDQAYFLYVVYEADIRRILFPLGKMTKGEIRRIAAGLHLITANKPESQDICFVEDGAYATLLDEKSSHPGGAIVDIGGNVMGKHGGIHRYTVGQRKGLGALGKRMFVKEIRTAENTIVVGSENDLLAKTIEVTDVILAQDLVVNPEIDYGIQVRYRSKPVKGRIVQRGPADFTVALSEPVRAIAPGQSAVFYEEEMVLGGGIIKSAA
jgi:tRNA-uridine 2-sulfurtransferase